MVNIQSQTTNFSKPQINMNNLLLSVAIGDIAGVPYEFYCKTKKYDKVDLLHPKGDYSDDTVCTFAIAEAFMHNLDVSENLWNRCRQDPYRGYGGRFRLWLMNDSRTPYDSLGNGSAMRCASAAFLANSAEECEELATRSAMPTHNHPEGVKGAVATALAIYHLLHGKDKEYVKTEVLAKYYPDWAEKKYADFHDSFPFNETCMLTVPPAIICFLESKDYSDCLKLCIALGGDADTLAAIAGPMAYAYYKEMPQPLIDNALRILPEWMLKLNDELNQQSMQ